MVAARESRRLRYSELELVPHLRALDGDVDDLDARDVARAAELAKMWAAIANIRLLIIMLTLVAGGDLVTRIAGFLIK